MRARISMALLAGVAVMSTTIVGLAADTSDHANVAGLAVAPGALVTSAAARAITAEDIRALLDDPAIRNAVGLSENSWDFSAPDGVPGFGPIRVAGTPVTTTTTTTTLSCAERDLQLITSIEEHGNANDVAADRLAAAAFSMFQARKLCGSGRDAEALALYDGTLRGLDPMHAAR
jgi:hypothetical protein